MTERADGCRDDGEKTPSAVRQNAGDGRSVAGDGGGYAEEKAAGSREFRGFRARYCRCKRITTFPSPG
ncbi:hypothetical protein VTH06DRAFT_5520 [Thermothelomyces fergusii]